MSFGFRQYDPQIGRFLSVDPLAELRAWESPYLAMGGMPNMAVDPEGLFWKELWGKITDFFSPSDPLLNGGELKEVQVIAKRKRKASSGDMSPIIIRSSMPLGGIFKELPFESGGGGGGSDGMMAFAIPLPYSPPLFPYPGTVPNAPSPESVKNWWKAVVRDTKSDINKLSEKMSREIDRIYKRVKGPNGYVYELRVNKAGIYTDVRGNYVKLEAGDIWKYGESTQMSRYSKSQIDNMVPYGVKFNQIYFGTQIEIKVFEKYLIYGYFFNHGRLPPGNSIFR